jgi:hypothetical protein
VRYLAAAEVVMLVFLPPFLPVMVVTSQLVLAAQDVPQFNVESGCRAAATTGVREGNSADACLRDEQQARDKVQQQWGTFSSASQSRCLRLSNSGGAPSYVELLTCLEMAKAAKSLPDEDRLNGFGGR